MNALEWNRDLTRPIEEIRAREQRAHRQARSRQGHGLVRGDAPRQVGLCVATLIARYVAPDNPAQRMALAGAGVGPDAGAAGVVSGDGGARRAAPRSPTSRRARRPPRRGGRDGASSAGLTPIGYVLSLEGADSIRTPRHLERAYAQGLRAVGPAHYGPGVYAQGTNACGVMGPHGHELLREMERLGIILDATHLCDDSFRDALDHFRGPVWASHSNTRTLVAHNRQFSDDHIRELIARGAVIGAAFDAWMIVPNWVRGTSTPASAGVTLDQRDRPRRSHLPDRRQRAPLHDRLGPRRRLRPRAVPVGRRDHRRPGEDPRPAAPPRLQRGRRAGSWHGNFVRFLRNAWS